MTAAPVPCPVCGRSLPPTTAGRIPPHWAGSYVPGCRVGACAGSDALAPAGDLFPDAPTVATIPAPGVPLDLFGG